jgi:hypothetical protein
MDNPQLGFTQRLDIELKSCSMPKQDPRKATTEELIRDMHRVLTGNGEFNHGIIFKVAAANTNLDILKDTTTEMSNKLDAQITKCAAIQQAHAIEAAEKSTVSKLGKALWDNKALIFVIVLFALVYMSNIAKSSSTISADERIAKLIDARLEKFIPGSTPLVSTPTKKP